MKRIIGSLFLLIGVLISCQKEISIDNVTSPTLEDTTRLKKFIILDTRQTSPNDTLFIYNYLYDNFRRCSKITVKDYQNNSLGYTYNYYRGTDTLITFRKLINQVYSDSVYEYFNYSNDGQMLLDSVLEFHSGSAVTLTYKYAINNNSLTTSIIHSNGLPFLIGKYQINKDNSGNITTEKDSSFSYNSGSYFYKNNSDLFSTYDIYQCPFYRIYPKRLTDLDYELITVDDIFPFSGFFQKNNIKTKTRTTLPSTSGLDNYNETYQYIYNVNNYPSTVIYKDLIFGDVYKGIYYY